LYFFLELIDQASLIWAYALQCSRRIIMQLKTWGA